MKNSNFERSFSRDSTRLINKDSTFENSETVIPSISNKRPLPTNAAFALATSVRHLLPSRGVLTCASCLLPLSAAGSAEQLELVGELLKELSVASERPEERRGALVELLKVARDDSPTVWEEHFKTMLLLLLETLGDKDVRMTAHTQTHTH